MIGHRVNRHAGPLLQRLFPKPAGTEEKPSGLLPIPEALPGPVIVFDAGVSIPLPAVLEKGLATVRNKEILVRSVAVVAVFGTALFGLIFIQLFFDWMFELPWLFRAGLLAGSVFLLKFLWTRMREELARDPLSEEQSAGLVERRFRSFGGSLLGAVELSGGKPGRTQGSPGLLQALVDEARDKAHGRRLADAVPMSAACLWVLALVAVLGAGIYCLAQSPSTSGILLQRFVLLNPDSPSGTRIQPGSQNLVVQDGGTAELSARASGAIPSSGHVELIYSDGRREEVPVAAVQSDPALFAASIPGVRMSFRYRFYLHDAEGGEYEVKVQSAPVLQSLKRMPRDPARKTLEDAVASGKIAWDQGSKLVLIATANSALKSASLILEGDGKKISLPMILDDFGKRTLRIELPENMAWADRCTLELVGENNLKGSEPVTYLFDHVSLPENPSLDSEKANLASAQGLRAKDRESMAELRGEPIRSEYGPMSRQYFKNISGGDNPPLATP